jgi:threonyl-tRNA synthetase
MEYVDRDGQKKNPYIIHRTSVGCYERTLALLIEKYAGAFPMWLAPNQVTILPVSNAFDDYAYEVRDALQNAGIRCELDNRNEKIGYRIREAKMSKVPYMLVLGEKEATSGTVTTRNRKDEAETLSIADAVAKFRKEIDEKAR